MIETIIFWVLAIGSVLGALVVVVPPFGHKPTRAAMGLMGSLFCCTGLYVLLSAHYVAALQLIGYAGTILLLFTGILILLDLTEDELGEARYTAAKTIGVFAIFVVFTKALRVLAVPIPSDVLADMSAGDMVNFGKADSITTLLFDGFLLPFELISLLLFVSVMGVIAMARLRGRAAI